MKLSLLLWRVTRHIVRLVKTNDYSFWKDRSSNPFSMRTTLRLTYSLGGLLSLKHNPDPGCWNCERAHCVHRRFQWFLLASPLTGSLWVRATVNLSPTLTVRGQVPMPLTFFNPIVVFRELVPHLVHSLLFNPIVFGFIMSTILDYLTFLG